MATPALELIGLRGEFRIRGTWHAAVRDVSLRRERDETLALVGESGCGKSVMALSVTRLVQPPAGRVAAGRILLDGQDLAALDEAALEALRRDPMAMIFQEPLTSLNPVITVGEWVAKSLRIHRGLSRAAALECAAGEPAWRGAGRLSPRGGTQPRRIGRCTRMNATLRSESRLPAQ